MNNVKILACRTMAIGVVATLGVGAGIARAAPPSHSVGDDAKQYVVRYSDLDLSKSAGAAALYARLQQAARAVCAPFEGRQLALATQHRACMDRAVAGAVAEVNRPLLSAYHQLRTKGRTAGPVQMAKVM